jgi:hypothetical protein
MYPKWRKLKYQPLYAVPIEPLIESEQSRSIRNTAVVVICAMRFADFVG